MKKMKVLSLREHIKTKGMSNRQFAADRGCSAQNISYLISIGTLVIDGELYRPINTRGTCRG